MNLLIDSGNSFVKWALASEDGLVTKGRCATMSVTCLYDAWQDYEVPERVVVANVAGKRVEDEISKVASSLWQLDAEFIVASKNCCGLINSYHKPAQLGVDRWMAIVAAFQMTGGPVIVVDCGTAVTIDLTDENGLYVGGVILPGVNTAFQSLKTGTDAVEKFNVPSDPVSSAEKSTEKGVYAGILLGLAGGIERIAREQALLVARVPVICMTGGDAEKLIPYLAVPVDLQADMVLQGLRIYTSE